MTGLTVLALVAVGCGGGKSGSSGGGAQGSSGPKVAQLGGAGEGPYPWQYPASGGIHPGTGTTVSGTTCSPGTPQFPSPYAPPCLPKFTGDNGGATSNGVTRDKILLAERVFPSTANSQAVAVQARNAGAALPQVTDQVEQVFLNYFNKAYELYGRHVEIQNVTATGNITAEALNQGQAQACADADTIANQVHAFGEAGLIDNFLQGGTGPFSTCAAQQKLVEFEGDAYFDEGSFQKVNPYVWNVATDCERISTQVAEVHAKYLVGKPAIYAGDADLKTRTRKFGTYTPNVPAYQHCASVYSTVMTNQYHVPADQLNTVFNYGLDISTFQQSTQQAILQFKAAGVTTVILACDPFSAAFLTKAAAAQNYHPEWLLNGAALTDLDQTGQTYDQSEVDGHLFGLSEAAPSQDTTGPNSLAGKLYRQLTGHEIPAGTDGNYLLLVPLFNALQAAGPNLTPENLARGVHALPLLGAPNYEYGSWNFNTGPSGQTGSGDHTAISDARFVYWDAKASSPLNGKQGTYVQIFGGKRFTLGTWPAQLPALFNGS
ncbi:MAG TPA: hypothetical protein VLL25_15095 [Acidimicrobiales bacterium]|nr:hypothetical protein [Acidimicrobiales bacterium]